MQNWQLLQDEADRAASELLNSTPNEFDLKYMRLHGEAGVDTLPYWRDLTMMMLRRLADAVEESAEDEVRRIAANFQQFPLCLDLTNDDMGRDALVQMAQRPRAITLPDRTPQTTTAPTLADGADSSKGPAVNAQIDRLSGMSVLQGERESWYRNVIGVVDALGQIEPIFVTVSIPIDDRNAAVRSVLDYFEIYVDGQRLIRQRHDLDPKELNRSFELPGGDVEFRFYEGVSNIVSARAEYSGPWNILRTIVANTSRPRRNNTQFDFPVELEVGSQNKRYTLWLQVDLSRAIPSEEDWPTTASWPRVR